MSGFDWDEANREHLAKHGFSQEEAKEAANGETFDFGAYIVEDELRFESTGSTLRGRILSFVTTDRADRVRFVTAFDASKAMRRLCIDAMMNRHE